LENLTQNQHSNRRTYERFDQHAKAFFYFHYDLQAKIDIQRERPVDNGKTIEKYPAESQNVSAEGLCFRSLHKLDQGNKLKLEMYLSEGKEPIQLEGEVRWSQASVPTSPAGFFDTGIRLLSINGRPVPDSIHYDNQYQLVWSDVLDIIFGNIRKLSQQYQRTQRVPQEPA
jgi:hypothetical protein